MLKRAFRRWTTCPTRSAIRRFLVFNSPSCFLLAILSIRRQSSTAASASALLRLDNPVFPVLQPPRLEYNAQGKLPVREQRNERHRCSTQQENSRELSFLSTPTPDGLLLWLDEHFASSTSPRDTERHIMLRRDWSKFLRSADSVVRVAEELAQTDVPQRALHILQAAHSIGYAFKQSIYERVVYQLAVSEEWNLVLAVVGTALDATGKTTTRLMNWRGRALLKVQNYAELDGLLEEFAKYGLKPQGRTFMLVLQGHLRNHDLARAKATISIMEKMGFPVTGSTYTTIVPAYRGFGMDNFIVERGYDVLNDNQPLQNKEKILNGLLRLHLDRHDLEGALRLLETFSSRSRDQKEKDRPASPGGGGKTAHVSISAPRSTLEDLATYTILINYLSKYGPTSLDGILQRMRGCGGTPDIKVAASLIRMHYARGEEHEALVVLRDCCKGHDLQVDALKSLGYDARHSPTSAFAPFTGRPRVELFNCVLHGAIHIRGLNATIPILRLMKDARVKPDARTLEIFLWHLSRERPVLTEDLVNAMRSLLSARIRPTLGMLNIILQGRVHGAKASRRGEGWNVLANYARHVIESLKDSGSGQMPQPKKRRAEPTFDPELCITDLQSNVFHDLLKPLIQSLHRRRVLADRATFSIRMHYDCLTLQPVRAPEAVARHLQIMRGRGLYPNVYHYAALMEAYCVAGNIYAAHEVLQDTITRGLVPQQKSHVILYTILISAHARIGRPDLALDVFREMLNADVVPDVASVDALLSAFFAVKAFRLARRVLLDLWPMVAPFPEELRGASLRHLITRLREIRDLAESPKTDVQKQTALCREELMQLSNDIIAEWRGIWQVHDGDAERIDVAKNRAVVSGR